jgi:hypothetical protein
MTWQSLIANNWLYYCPCSKSTKILLAIKHGHSTSGWREGVRCFFLLSQSQSHVDRLSEKKNAPLRTINRCMHHGHETGSVSFNFFFSFVPSFLPSDELATYLNTAACYIGIHPFPTQKQARASIDPSATYISTWRPRACDNMKHRQLTNHASR